MQRISILDSASSRRPEIKGAKEDLSKALPALKCSSTYVVDNLTYISAISIHIELLDQFNYYWAQRLRYARAMITI